MFSTLVTLVMQTGLRKAVWLPGKVSKVVPPDTFVVMAELPTKLEIRMEAAQQRIRKNHGTWGCLVCGGPNPSQNSETFAGWKRWKPPMFGSLDGPQVTFEFRNRFIA